jgi:tRNA(Ile)-lysidine synthase
VLEKVAETIARHRMFEAGQKVGVAVSGGADSVCLLHVLRQLAPRWALHLEVLHIEHGLRGEASRADMEYVRELAAEWGLQFHCHAADVRRISEEAGENLEQAARQVRRQFFASFLGTGRLDRVATGHTRSDQAETVLFRFLRGSGTAGLVGILPVTREGLVRPMIGVDRAEVERYLREHGVGWRDDATNRDLGFARNRIRHVLLPELAREWNPGLAATLAATAAIARDEEEYWRDVVERTASGLVVEPPAVLFRAAWLAGLPGALARRVARRAVEVAKGDLRGLEFGHIERILEMAATEEGSGRFQAPGLDVMRSFDWVRMAPPGSYAAGREEYRMALSIPGEYRTAGGWRIGIEIAGADSGYNKEESALDWGRITQQLELRNWQPGDQYRPVGHATRKKIKQLFQEARIPLWRRRGWPVITCGEEIVWAARFGAAAEYTPGAATHGLLKIRETGNISELCE